MDKKLNIFHKRTNHFDLLFPLLLKAHPTVISPFSLYWSTRITNHRYFVQKIPTECIRKRYQDFFVLGMITIM